MFGSEQIKEILAEYERREVYIQEQLAHFQAQATTYQSRRIYAYLLRAFTRERREMQVRRPLLLAMLAAESGEENDDRP